MNIQQLADEVLMIVRKYTPVDTGTLKNDAINMEFNDDKTFTIYVDESIAPYMPYTNEPWKSDRWNGKKNPNEAWWQEVVLEIVEYIVENYNGEEQ